MSSSILSFFVDKLIISLLVVGTTIMTTSLACLSLSALFFTLGYSILRGQSLLIHTKLVAGFVIGLGAVVWYAIASSLFTAVFTG
jgi:hypothetical protein